MPGKAPLKLSHSPLPAARIERRLFHLCAASVLPTLLFFLPRLPVLCLTLALTAVVLVGEGLRFRFPAFNKALLRLVAPLTKEKEQREPFASTYLLIAASLVIALFPKPIAVLALFFLAIGDPLAALVGQRWGRHHVASRTLEGSAAFALGGLAIGAVLIVGGLEVTWPVLAVGLVVATLAELAPSPIDDNLKVPLAGVAALLLTQRFWG